MSARLSSVCQEARPTPRIGFLRPAKSVRTFTIYVACVFYPVVGAQTANERSRGLPLAGEVMRWLFTGKGMLIYSLSIVAASVKVLEESATPDMQATFAPSSFNRRRFYS
jgi:hypothetical protein